LINFDDETLSPFFVTSFLEDAIASAKDMGADLGVSNVKLNF
jgi:hypothetical protein